MTGKANGRRRRTLQDVAEVVGLSANTVSRALNDMPGVSPASRALIKAELATYKTAGVKTSIYPRLAGSWPGYVFTSQPVGLPAGQFGLGCGAGAHAPDEFMLIESANPKIQGYDGATLGFVDFLYQIAMG